MVLIHDVEVHAPHQESESLFVVGVTIFASIFDYFMGFRKCVKSFISCIPCYTCKLFYTMFILWSEGADTTLKCYIPCLFYDLMALIRRWSVYTMFILCSDGADATLKCFIQCLFYDLMVLKRRWSVLYHVYSMIGWCWYDVEVFYTMFILWSDDADTTLKCFIPFLFYDLMALIRRWSACTTPGKWEFICSSDNDFSFYLRLLYGISEMFRKCGIFVFHFTVVFLLRFLIISLVHLHLQSFNCWCMTISYM